MKRFAVPLVFALVFLTSRVNAQTATGEAAIRVLDPSGAVIPHARIEVLGSAGNWARTLATDDSGVAERDVLQPGRPIFSIRDRLRQAGRRKACSSGSVRRPTRPSTPRTGEDTESVTVVGGSQLVEQKSSTLAQVTEQREIRGLPLNGRNYLQLASLTPGAVPSTGSRDKSFAAYGNTGLQNAFLLDGARNDNYLRGLDNRARDMVRPPLDAINEFTVQTSNYSSEFGASAGGVVNVVTKSGTNQIHGTAYDYLRNDNLDAADYFAVNGHKPLLVQNQFGGSLGGPVIRNRAWLFGAYEGLHDRSEGAALSTVPIADIHNGRFRVHRHLRSGFPECRRTAKRVSGKQNSSECFQSYRPIASKLVSLAEPTRHGE